MNTQIIERDNSEHAGRYDAAAAQLQQVYSHAFGARPQTMPPRFAVTFSARGDIICAAGIRLPSEGFFSQCYLDEPIEVALSRQAGVAVAADQIIEVGALATQSPFPVFPTLRAISDWGRARDMSWAIFTGTTEVRRLITRAKISAIMVCPAARERVSDPQVWGRYYEHDPWVCAFADFEIKAACAPSAAEIA